MRNKWFMPAMLLAAPLLLGGCFTARLLMPHTNYKETARDDIIAFAIAEKDSPQLQRGDLLMQGRAYWYIVRPAVRDSVNLDPLRELLRENWSGTFALTDESGLKNPDALEIRTGYDAASARRRNIQSTPCLRYQTRDPAEANRLKAKGFQNITNSPTWHRCFELAGVLYQNPDGGTAQQTLRQTIPVKIMAPYHGNAFSPLHVVALPFTLTADVITLVPTTIAVGITDMAD